MRFFMALLAVLPVVAGNPSTLSASVAKLREDLVGLGGQASSIGNIAKGTDPSNVDESAQLVMVQIMMLRFTMTGAERRITEHKPFDEAQEADYLLGAYEQHFASQATDMASNLEKACPYFSNAVRRRVSFLLYKFLGVLQSYDHGFYGVVSPATSVNFLPMLELVENAVQSTIEAYGIDNDRYGRLYSRLWQTLDANGP